MPEHTSEAVYVKFKVEPESLSRLANFNKKLQTAKDISFVIWTTTSWTLTSNLAIAVNPEFDYDFLEMQSGELLVVASLLRESFLATTGLSEHFKGVAATISGKELGIHKNQASFF